MILASLLTLALAGGVLPAGAQPPEGGDLVAPVAIRVVPAAVATPVRAPAAQLCRSSIETGSLIKRHKACLTAKQWDYVDQAHRDEARKMMMDNMGRAPGG